MTEFQSTSAADGRTESERGVQNTKLSQTLAFIALSICYNSQRQRRLRSEREGLTGSRLQLARQPPPSPLESLRALPLLWHGKLAEP